MKKILLHQVVYASGGPNAVLDSIASSYLKDKYEFERLYETGACGYNPFAAIRFVRKYRKEMNKSGADLIYINGLHYNGFLITLAAKLSRIKKIAVCIHGSDWDNPNKSLRKKLLMYFFEPLTVRMADAMVTVCKNELKCGALRLGGHGNIFGEVYNQFPGIDFDSYEYGTFRRSLGIPDDKIVVTNVGRCTKFKGHKYLMDAISSADDSDFVFVIVGGGEYEEKYRERFPDRINNGSLFVLGNRTDVYSILRDSDVFVFPTLNENHSIALMEAVNMRCAVICTNVGGNPEVIDDGETGIVIPAHDSAAIVRALYMMKDKDLREKYATKAYDVVSERFSLKNTIGKLETLFDKLLG